MTLYVYDIYSGYIEDTLNIVGSRDKTMVERYLRLGDFAQRTLGLDAGLMYDWESAMKAIIMDPPASLQASSECVAMLMLLSDAGHRRFRIVTQERQDEILLPFFEHLGHAEFCKDFTRSAIADYLSPIEEIQWGFLDVEQCKALLLGVFGDESFMQRKTAAIAGRLSHMKREDAENALLEVGIETQGSVSSKIDYLIIGSKGTTGTKQSKALKLNSKGDTIKVLDEAGFDELLRSPKKGLASWSAAENENYEEFVRALRHVWACDLDLYCLSFVYDPEDNLI
ncbi:MAG: BRCT domain-containing protein [Bradymonadales bacterium]